MFYLLYYFLLIKIYILLRLTDLNNAIEPILKCNVVTYHQGLILISPQHYR